VRLRQDHEATGAAAGTLSILGPIRDSTTASHLPVPGIKVSLSGAATKTTFTNSDGFFRFQGLAAGSYTLKASKSGATFTPSSLNIPLGAEGAVAKVTFTAGCGATASAPADFKELVIADEPGGQPRPLLSHHLAQHRRRPLRRLAGHRRGAALALHHRRGDSAPPPLRRPPPELRHQHLDLRGRVGADGAVHLTLTARPRAGDDGAGGDSGAGGGLLGAGPAPRRSRGQRRLTYAPSRWRFPPTRIPAAP
jgi:hypothetical protein